MSNPLRTGLGVLLATTLVAAPPASAQITSLEVEVVASPAFDGQRFGDVGRYEHLRGVARGEIDPDDPRHPHVVNLDLAPRNARGRVEYETTVDIMRPVDLGRWNRAIHHTVPNRGRLRRAGGEGGALLERGFALVWVGWQGDLADTGDNLVARLPVAVHPDGSPVTGPALEEIIFDDPAPSSRARLTYPAATLDPTAARLTVRATQTAARQAPSDLRWRYRSDREIEINRPAGFDAGAIYEFIYEARDPIVLGVGFAAMRDVVSFLRYRETDDDGRANPLSHEGLADVAISLGVSQSGRVLRDFLYQGFNEDTDGRIVFDGMHPNIAGSRKSFTNYAFGQPGRWQKQHEDHVYPGDQFPFTYTTLTDPISGRTDGLLERCRASDTCPKIVHSDSEAELWQARASLVVTDTGGRDIDLPEDVRVYLVAGTQHGGGPGVHAAPAATPACAHPANPIAIGQIRTALDIALHEWVAHGTPPPASRFPRVTDGGLVDAASLSFPAIPGVSYGGSVNPLHLLADATLPPTRGAAYPVRVGRVDADGNMTDGVRHPDLAAPLGTFTGWNLRAEGYAPGAQCRGTGSFLAFARDEAARERRGDPRPSLATRYPTHDDYVTGVRAAADALVRDRLLLPADAERIVGLAERSGVARTE